MFSLGIETKIATMPNTIRASSGPEQRARPRREVPASGVSVGAQRGDERRGGSGRLPQSGRVGIGVVGEDGADRESEQKAHPEQESDRELLEALGAAMLRPKMHANARMNSNSPVTPLRSRPR